MKTITFNTYKAATKFPLLQIASYFNLNQDGWKEFIKIESHEIEKIFMYEDLNKSVYIYRYGCITFVNFNQHEIQYFFDYLAKIYVDIDHLLISKFNETHFITVNDNNKVKISEDDEEYEYSRLITDMAATVLAKSTELHKIEAELTVVLDEAEKLINYLHKGKLRANSKMVISIIAQCTRFKFRTVESVRLLDRPPEFDKTIETRKIFDAISNVFELVDRYSSVLSRTDVLDSITEEYFSFKSNQSERRLLMFEILLLALFPLKYFLT